MIYVAVGRNMTGVLQACISVAYYVSREVSRMICRFHFV